ncbi:MAG: hypothetical protein H0X26_06825 [Alphaproteobacteria bacterium]|nr:hypothetical protein [Alphaproteobacteria bacterium]
MSLINIIPMILKMFPLQKLVDYKHLIKKIILYGISSLFLISFYVFGSIALYYYLIPYWGEATAALSLCLLSLFIGIALILTARLLKVKKKPPPPQLLPLLEKSFDQMLNTKDLTKILYKASPKVLITVLGAVALGSYAVFWKKK